MAFNLDLSPQHEALITHVMEMSALKSKKDVIENALTLMGWAVAASAKGLSIASVDDERKIYREIQTPALVNARLQAQIKKNGVLAYA
jgi:hypothetical protein